MVCGSFVSLHCQAEMLQITKLIFVPVFHSTKNSYQKYIGIFDILKKSLNKQTDIKRKIQLKRYVRKNFVSELISHIRLVKNLALWEQIEKNNLKLLTQIILANT